MSDVVLISTNPWEPVGEDHCKVVGFKRPCLPCLLGFLGLFLRLAPCLLLGLLCHHGVVAALGRSGRERIGVNIEAGLLGALVLLGVLLCRGDRSSVTSGASIGSSATSPASMVFFSAAFSPGLMSSLSAGRVDRAVGGDGEAATSTS
ncbi:MAG: hypothetical protein ACLS89_06340 [Collinsella sp.]